MTDVVELELQLVELEPNEAGCGAKVQGRNLLVDNPSAEREVAEHLILGVRLHGSVVAVELANLAPMLLPRHEGGSRVLEIQVCPEDRVVGDVPESVLVLRGVPHRLGACL